MNLNVIATEDGRIANKQQEEEEGGGRVGHGREKHTARNEGPNWSSGKGNEMQRSNWLIPSSDDWMSSAEKEMFVLLLDKALDSSLIDTVFFGIFYKLERNKKY